MLTQACTNRVILICNAEAHAIFNQIGTSERMMPEENAPITGECKQREQMISCWSVTKKTMKLWTTC